jgi:tetratricopeptide (TPR) repeat protein
VGEDGSRFTVLSNVQLSLVTAEGQQFVQSVWPDQNSNLVAERLVPGKYILGLNTYLPATRGSPYPPIYYPGVSRLSEAKVITLGPGEHKVLPEMRIKKSTPCEIPVRVLDKTGKPSPSTELPVFYLDYPHYYDSDETDASGKGDVYAVFPGPVFLRAEKPIPGQPDIQSEPVELDTCPAAPIQLKLMHAVGIRKQARGESRLNSNNAGTREEPSGKLAKVEEGGGAAPRSKEPMPIEPDSYLQHEYLGEVLDVQGDSAGAIKEFRAALSLEPKFVLAHVRLGYALGDSGDYDGEIAEQREALRLNPQDDGARVGLGFALQSTGDWAGGEAEALAALRLNPNNDQAHVNLAWAFDQKGDLDAVIREERLALGLNPDNFMARDGLGNALGKNGDPEGAIDVFSEALSRDSNDDVAHAGLGSALNAQRKWQESDRENREALRLNPANAQAHANLGISLAHKRLFDQALAECHEALRLNPQSDDGHFCLGAVAEAKGTFQEASQEYHKAIEINPNEPT